ncbi:MAG: hypothetical protein EZS28_002467 [Streblomastix strix]|uniref:E3 ubiquitin-protein ligase n=1 Tax=Streblomastix strix TaxID=222440 RepID=A0A5J4X460_9EUKA|nr:MAG: hypothetical protein EZS28_002467 [Streblomastix strix]
MRRIQCPHCSRSKVETVGLCLLCGRVICISDKCCQQRTKEIRTVIQTKPLKSEIRESKIVKTDQVTIIQNITQTNELEITDSSSGIMSPWGIRMSPLEEVRHSLQCCGMILPAMGAYVDVVNYHMEKIRPIRLSGIYLDAYGEEDLGNWRGKPLILSVGRYSKLLQQLCEHSWHNFH